MSTAWMQHAACAGRPEHFFGLDGESETARNRRESKAFRVCRPCPVRLECAGYALARPEAHGVWGATGEALRAAERRRYLRRQQTAGGRAA